MHNLFEISDTKISPATSLTSPDLHANYNHRRINLFSPNNESEAIMSIVKFAFTGAVTPKMTRVMFYLLRECTHTGMKRAKVQLFSPPSRNEQFRRLDYLMMNPPMAPSEWAEIFDLAWRELQICSGSKVWGYNCPHRTLSDIKDLLENGVLLLSMIYRPTTILFEYIDPFKVMLEAINKNASTDDVIASIVTGFRTPNEAKQIYEALELLLSKFHIEPIVPFDRTEESYLKQ